MITVEESSVFTRWIDRLKDSTGKARILKRIKDIREKGHFGDIGPVGDDVWELRFFFGPGYRVYYIREGDTVVILLNGGDKGSQNSDIERAKEIAKDWKAS